MDEIEYKLKTNNSVLVVNAIDKLILTIKSKYKPVDRQKFVLENEELKFLREKCSAKEPVVSLTACQGLLALVESGVLEIGYTMSTIVTLLPIAQNISAIISTIAGLLILDLRSRLVPGQPYTCQFSLRSPQHPFITVLEKKPGAEEDIIVQMQALCNHPDYTISSNSLELIRTVVLWLVCEANSNSSLNVWRLLLSLPNSGAQQKLLIHCLSLQQQRTPIELHKSCNTYAALIDTGLTSDGQARAGLLPVIACLAVRHAKCGVDPRPCYRVIERCFHSEAVEGPELSAAGLVLHILSENLMYSAALYLHELFNLCLNIISKYECSTLSLNILASLSLQWLHQPSCLTSAALKVAAKILDIYQQNTKHDNRLFVTNLKNNLVFMSLMYTDVKLTNTFNLCNIWERSVQNINKLNNYLDSLSKVDSVLQYECLPFLLGVVMVKNKEYEEIVLKSLEILVDLVKHRKEVAIHLLPVLLHKIANEYSPTIKMACLKALPIMALSKENVPMIVSILNKLKVSKGVPSSFLIMLYTSLAETQVRCFPYLQELLVDVSVRRSDDLKWETEIARAMAVKRICELRPTTNGLELVSVLSSILNKCTDRSGSIPAKLALEGIKALWEARAVAAVGTWRALEMKLSKDNRPIVQIAICNLLSTLPSLRVSSPEFDSLTMTTAEQLWRYISESNSPEVVHAACDALACYRLEDYTLKQVPEIYRRTVKLPASYCKTPLDAARKPEDVLDYIPCEIWPEVFKYTNPMCLDGVIKLISKLIEREIRGYRSAVYQPQPMKRDLSYLPVVSVYRGVAECFRKQAVSPSYDISDQVLLAMLSSLCSEYPKPFPPLELCFLHELFHKGSTWKALCLTLAARQAGVVPSGRQLVENYLNGVANGGNEEDTQLIFDLLPVLCRNLPPNSLRPVLERCLADSFDLVARVKAKSVRRKDTEPEPQYRFLQQLEKIKECLETDKIHDANRTLLSQIIENYLGSISDDNVSWPTYVSLCKSLSTKYLERMTSPSGWWEVTSELLRKSCAIRCALASSADCDSPLVWLNETIDVHAKQIIEQDFSLQCMIPAFKAAKVDDNATKEWFLQLMARTQVAFKEAEDDLSNRYLINVFMLSVIIFSGHWSFESDVHRLRDCLPAAITALVERSAWRDCTLRVLEWLSHTRSVKFARQCCQRALFALRHTDQFVEHKMWKRLYIQQHIECNTSGHVTSFYRKETPFGESER